MTNPISPARLAANRANAARSTGPRSVEGKARSAKNARTHGLAAVTQSEDPLAVARLRESLIALYRPANAQELFAVERIAFAQHALLRCASLEAGLLSVAMNDTPEEEADEANVRLALGFLRMSAESDTWKLFLRYQAQTERMYRRAVEELERIRELRDQFPNEPTNLTEPQQTAPHIPIPPQPLFRMPAPFGDPDFRPFGLSEPPHAGPKLPRPPG